MPSDYEIRQRMIESRVAYSQTFGLWLACSTRADIVGVGDTMHGAIDDMRESIKMM